MLAIKTIMLSKDYQVTSKELFIKQGVKHELSYP
jgi:hypothetical protein